MTKTAILKDRKDAEGKQKIIIRIAHKNRREFITTKLKVFKADFEKGKVKDTHPDHNHFNNLIKKLLVESQFRNDPEEIRIQGKDFFKYCLESISAWERGKDKKDSTLVQHKSEVNKIKGFCPSLKLSDITPEWLNKYKSYCFGLGNEGCTVHKNLRFVRVIIRKAHREGLIKKNPFDIFEMPKFRNPEKKYLTKDQVQVIEKLIYNKELPETVRKVAAWFCIGCYTGLRFGDMQRFNKKKHIINSRMILYTMKTGTPVSMPESERLRRLFEEVNYQWVGINNRPYNRILRAIATMCELGHLNAHQSRHTAAIMWANAGISQEVTAKLLGHTDLKSTAIYYKITSLRIDEELKKIG